MLMASWSCTVFLNDCPGVVQGEKPAGWRVEHYSMLLGHAFTGFVDGIAGLLTAFQVIARVGLSASHSLFLSGITLRQT